MANKIIQLARTHKFISAVIIVAIAGGGYYWYRSAQGSTTVTKYVLQAASQGTVVASVSGSGQVEPVTSIDVKSQGGSGNVVRIAVGVGQYVTAGQLLVQLDTTNEQKSVDQAQLSLQSAQLSLAKLQESPATTTLQQDEDAVTQAQQSLVQASTTLQNDYQSGYDSLGTVFVDLQNVTAGLQNFVLGKDLNKIQNDPDAFISLLPQYLQAGATPYRDDVESTYSAAITAYQQNLTDYHAINRNASPTQLDALFTETANTAKRVSDAVTASKGLITDIINNYPSSSSTNPLPAITNTDETSFANYIQTANSDISTLTGITNTIMSDRTAITNDNLSLTEHQDSLTALQAGPDNLDVQSQQISIQNAQMALQTAQQNLAYDSIRAPIDGIVSSIPAIIGEAVPSPAVTIVTNDEVAQVTLNEIDAAKVSLGNKATVTFDAFPNLSLAGQVVELDPVGTVSQGVVNYNAQVAFQNAASSSDSVKPGMSATANIVTQVGQNVIAVPNAAVVTQSGSSYVLEPATPVSASDLAASVTGGVIIPQGTKMVPVTVGLSNNTMTEITSGVNVGDQIIIQTIKSATGGAASAGTNPLRALGGGGGGVFVGGGAGSGFGGGTGARTTGGAAAGR